MRNFLLLFSLLPACLCQAQNGRESFREHGWYHFTRLELLAGQSNTGFGAQHSSGFRFSRQVSVGIGTGVEVFDPGDYLVPTYPVFCEFRGYLLAEKISPFYALGVGYGFSPANALGGNIADGPRDTWKGGWLFQPEIGYRIGSHLIVQFGLRLQRKTHYRTYPWSDASDKDRILHRRFEVGVGLLI